MPHIISAISVAAFGFFSLIGVAWIVNLVCDLLDRWFCHREVILDRKPFVIRRIREGEMMPRFYGCAYYDYMRRYQICFPIPLNILVQAWMVFYDHWIRMAKRGPWRDLDKSRWREMTCQDKRVICNLLTQREAGYLCDIRLDFYRQELLEKYQHSQPEAD